jgi:aminoglycoside phosphotransferase (APT) family kinase protein
MLLVGYGLAAHLPPWPRGQVFPWQAFRTLPRTGPDAMTHGELVPGNLRVADHRLTGGLDVGGLAAADLDELTVLVDRPIPSRAECRAGRAAAKTQP